MNLSAIDKIVCSILDRAIENLATSGYLVPVGFIIIEGRVENIVALQFDSPETKYASMNALGQIADKFKADAVAFVADVWVSVRSDDAPDYGVRPSEDPDRKEAVIICAKCRSGEVMGAMVPYEKSPDGFHFDDRKDFGENNAYFGIMDEIFHQDVSTH